MKKIKFISFLDDNDQTLAIKYIRSKQEWIVALSMINAMNRFFNKIYYNFNDDMTNPQLKGVSIKLNEDNNRMKPKRAIESFLYNSDTRYALDNNVDMDKTFVYMRFPFKSLKNGYSGSHPSFSELADFLSKSLYADDEMFRILDVNSEKLELIVFINPNDISQFKFDTAEYLRKYYGQSGVESLKMLNDIIINIGSFQ